MEVILLEDIENLGKFGDCVQVASGYARNFLLPQKLAEPNSPTAQRTIESKKRLKEKGEVQALSQAKSLAEKIAATSLTIVRQVGEKDKLFGSVTAIDIAKALKEEKINIDKKHILLEEPLKALGIYTVPIKLHRDITSELKLWVVKT